MTVVISAHGAEFVVVGADSRETLQDRGGTRVEINTVVKLFPATKHTVAMLCGESGQATNLVELFRQEIKPETVGVRKVASKLAEVAQREAIRVKDVPMHPEYFPSFGFIVSGLDVQRNGKPRPQSFGLHSDTGFRLEASQGGFMIDGKPIIPRYIFAKNYRPDMTVEDLSNLVAQALYDTARVDGDVGAPFKLMVIDSGGWRELSDADIKEDLQAW